MTRLKNDKIEIRFAGAGGQGLQAAASVLGQSIINSSDLHVAQAQNYGPESRGGLSYSDLIISREEIDFPKVKTPDVLVCMSNESYLRFKTELGNGSISILVIDPEMIPVKRLPKGSENVRFYRISATLESEAIFDNRIGANMVLVGALHEILGVGNAKAIEKTMAEEWPEWSEQNIAAFRKGRELAREDGS